MLVKSIAECSAILSTFIKLPFVIKIFVLSLYEWQLTTGFTVLFFLQLSGIGVLSVEIWLRVDKNVVNMQHRESYIIILRCFNYNMP